MTSDIVDSFVFQSSILSSNFSVGSIFALWPSNNPLLSLTGRDVVLSAVAVYGPKTIVLVAIPPDSYNPSGTVKEFTLSGTSSDKWSLTSPNLSIPQTPTHKTFAFGNLRCTSTSPKYKSLLDYYLSNNYTLRYTGGMVPDVCQIVLRSGGIFTNCSSREAKAKLRYLYEVAAMAVLVVTAGGAAVTEDGRDMLDVRVDDFDLRVGGCLGSKDEVDNFKKIMGV